MFGSSLRRRTTCTGHLPGAGRVFAIVVLGVLGVLLLGACGAAAQGSGPPALGALPTIRSSDDIRLPLDTYLGTRADRAVRETAREQLVSACMARLGFAGYPVEDLAYYARLPQHMNTFGVTSIADAETGGFATPAARLMTAGGARYDRTFSRWSGDDVIFALNGPHAPVPGGTAPAATTAKGRDVPPGGCEADATRRLAALAHVPVLDGIWLDDEEGQMIQSASDDPRMTPVTAAYAACMHTAGYSYATPSDAINDPRWEGDMDLGPRPGERQAAVASVRCQQQSRFLDTWVALATAYELRFVEHNAERLQQFKTVHETVLAAVRAQGLGALPSS
jgi:hypothetical protein